MFNVFFGATSIYDMQNIYHNIGLREKKPFFSRKLAKIAENRPEKGKNRQKLGEDRQK
jgi:hypothetical protein